MTAQCGIHKLPTMHIKAYCTFSVFSFVTLPSLYVTFVNIFILTGFYMHKYIFHGTHIFGLTNFPDSSSIFSISTIFFIVVFNKFNKYTSIKKTEKNWLKFPNFSSILGKIPWLFPHWTKVSHFPCKDFMNFGQMWRTDSGGWCGAYFFTWQYIKHSSLVLYNTVLSSCWVFYVCLTESCTQWCALCDEQTWQESTCRIFFVNFKSSKVCNIILCISKKNYVMVNF